MTRIGPLMRFCLTGALGAGLIAAAVGVADARSGRDCRQEWRAHKADIKSQGKSRRSFMRACRAEKAATPQQPSTKTQTQ